MVDEKKTPAEAEDINPDEIQNDIRDETSPVVEDDAATEQPQPRKSNRGTWIALLVLGLVVAGGYSAWPELQQMLQPQPQPSHPNAEVMATVDKLRHRVAQLEAASTRRGKAIPDIKAATEKNTQKLDDLAKTIPGGELLGDLGRKLSNLEDSMAHLGQKASEDGVAALRVLNQELDGLKHRLNELADGDTKSVGAAAEEIVSDIAALIVNNKQLRATVTALQDRLAQLEQSMREAQSRRDEGRKAGRGEGLVLAVGQLRQTVLAGRAYGSPLAAFSALVEGNADYQAAILTLTPNAKQGIPTLNALSVQFPSVARAVLQADPKDDGGFLRRTWRRISSLVTVRRVGEVAGEEADAVLARAERRLDAGELAAAIKLMEGLDGAAGAAAQAWLERARTRLGAEVALAELQTQVIAGLAAN
ncbi:MAG: hypothetical protein HOK30_03365 [Rhodospirillaceae bacterium]|jgi:hypothetical protein|nr:hypothetical protein [Rhodospirillaceae bacterium]MBT5192825.1 hypothetical protein [Rhodospirillaceae bacterium]MBT5896757.1 hypothetical protein [Rhodospirillaceae bacterium]MBT6426676.1 hypothetical protein [Rhodospirillaceae bacterium]MBT7761015.1 hypothetical protein [Rhodospirillaceae bacterium]